MAAAEPDDLQRDKLLSRLLAESLAASTANGGACTEVETIAAYADRSLPSEVMAQLDAHFANCARCQQVLVGVALSSDEPPARVDAIQPQPQPMASPFPNRRPAPRFAQTHWRWLAPAAGIAAAVAIWFALCPTPPFQIPGSQPSTRNEISVTQSPNAQPGTQAGAQNSSEIAEANISTAPAPLPAPVASVPAVTGATSSQEPRQLDALKTPEAAAETRAAAARSQPAGPPLGGAPSPQFLRAQQSLAPAPTSKTETVTGDLPAVNIANTELGGTLEHPAVGELPVESRNYPYLVPLVPIPRGEIGTRGELRAASSAPVSHGETAAKSSGAATGSGAVSALAARPRILAPAAVPASTFASPSESVLWRIGAAGSIQRSSDRGRTWQRQLSGVTGDLLAGAAASDQAAWIVGRGGIILRTTDGTNWQRVRLPPEFTANTALDLTAVQASDALRATITATGGRHFATEDGGKTWTAQ